MDSRAITVFTVLGSLLFLLFFYMSFAFIGAFSLGIFIYYCTRPIYRYLTGLEVNKTVSALFSQIVFLIPALLLLAYTIQIVLFELRSFASDAGGIASDILDQSGLVPKEDVSDSQVEGLEISGTGSQDKISSLNDVFNYIDSGTLDSIILSAVDVTTMIISSVSGVFFVLFIAFSFSFYLQRDGEKAYDIVYGLLDHDENIKEYLNELDRDLRVVYLGNIALATGTAVVGATSYYLLAVFAPGGDIMSYPGLLGILCGAGSLIPVIGMKLVYFPVTLLMTGFKLIENPSIDALFFPLMFFFVSLIVVDGIPDLVARPYVGSFGGVSTGVLLFSYIIGPLALGWYGLFLGPLIFVALYEFTIHILPDLIDEYKNIISRYQEDTTIDKTDDE